MLGRRGPAQAAFTNPELRELADLELADVIVDPADVDARSAQPGAAIPSWRTARSQRNVETLDELCDTTPRPASRSRIVLRFLTSPVEIVGDGQGQARAWWSATS